VECGIKSDELSILHGANSFIHIFFFYANRQRRIGGVATTGRSHKKPLKPVLHMTLCCLLGFTSSFILFVLLFVIELRNESSFGLAIFMLTM